MYGRCGPPVILLPRAKVLTSCAFAITVMTVMMAGGLCRRPGVGQPQPAAATIAEIDRTMENYRLDAHIPGMVWGIVQDGRLIHVKGAGVQDLDAKRPVGADTLFRIASMTKAFTALPDPEAPRRGQDLARCAGRDLRAGTARVEVSDQRLAEDSRA